MTTSYNPGRAALWMLGAIAGMTSMAMAGRAVAGHHDTFEIMAWRSIVGLVLVVAGAAASGQLGAIRARNLGLHALRNIFHFAGQNLWFAALTMIPLAQVFALEFSSPILVALASPFLLAEVLTRRRLGAAAMGFAGVLIVANPWGSGGVGLGTIFAMLCAVGFAGSILFTKILTRVAPVVEILFWLTVFQFAFGLVLAIADGHIAWPTTRTLPWLVLIGVAGIGAHFCLTRALSLAPASIVAPIDFARLPLIAVVGALFYDEPLAAPIFLGGALILWANWINIRGERATSRDAASPQDAT